MAIMSFPSEYERSILAGRGIPYPVQPKGANLRELMRSDENFLSSLEAIHYLSFSDR